MFENFQHGFRVIVYVKKDNSAERVVERVVEKVAEKVVENLSQNMRKIISLIQENSNVSANDIAASIGISHRKTQENIKKLKERGIVKRIGPAKGGHWEIIK